MSNAYIVGNLTRDIELRFTSSGTAVANGAVVVNKKWNDRVTGEQKEAASFFDFTAWGELAEHAAESLQKGDRVVINGRLEQRSWENDNGEKRSKVEVVADEISPSLRWNNVEISRTKRNEGDSNYSDKEAPF